MQNADKYPNRFDAQNDLFAQKRVRPHTLETLHAPHVRPSVRHIQGQRGQIAHFVGVVGVDGPRWPRRRRWRYQNTTGGANTIGAAPGVRMLVGVVDVALVRQSGLEALEMRLQDPLQLRRELGECAQTRRSVELVAIAPKQVDIALDVAHPIVLMALELLEDLSEVNRSAHCLGISGDCDGSEEETVLVAELKWHTADTSHTTHSSQDCDQNVPECVG